MTGRQTVLGNGLGPRPCRSRSAWYIHGRCQDASFMDASKVSGQRVWYLPAVGVHKVRYYPVGGSETPGRSFMTALAERTFYNRTTADVPFSLIDRHYRALGQHPLANLDKHACLCDAAAAASHSYPSAHSATLKPEQHPRLSTCSPKYPETCPRASQSQSSKQSSTRSGDMPSPHQFHHRCRPRPASRPAE